MAHPTGRDITAPLVAALEELASHQHEQASYFQSEGEEVLEQEWSQKADLTERLGQQVKQSDLLTRAELSNLLDLVGDQTLVGDNDEWANVLFELVEHWGPTMHDFGITYRDPREEDGESEDGADVY
jgi:hypothetical protein